MNLKELRKEIKLKGYIHNHLAQQIGISRYSFSMKINGKNEFKWSEIEKLAKILKLTNKEKNDIFFSR